MFWPLHKDKRTCEANPTGENTSLSRWDGLIELQLFAKRYSIIGIPIVHCGHLREYSNQQPLTRVEYILRPG